jgi:hypothetical protein
MKKLLLLGLSSLLLTSLAYSQEILTPGPFGVPTAVHDEANNWSTPIQVYSDGSEDIYIPDITRGGWLAWFSEPYKQNGVYLISIYEYFKTPEACRQRYQTALAPYGNVAKICTALKYSTTLLGIDTRNHTVDVERNGFTLFLDSEGRWVPQISVRFNQKRPEITTTITRVSALVDKASREYVGVTAQQARENNQNVQLHIFQQVTTHSEECRAEAAAGKPIYHDCGGTTMRPGTKEEEEALENKLKAEKDQRQLEVKRNEQAKEAMEKCEITRYRPAVQAMVQGGKHQNLQAILDGCVKLHDQFLKGEVQAEQAKAN